MPLTYKIEEDVGLITLTLSGQVTGSDISDYVAASRVDPAFRPTMHRLVVVEGIDGFPQLPEVREITTRTHAGPPNPATRIAAVAQTPLGLGMLAMFFGHWGLSEQYRLFDDVPTARAWILSNDSADE
jgi:hypothetical protein